MAAHGGGTYLFAKEDNVGLDEPAARALVAPDDVAPLDRLAHPGGVVLLLAVDAVLGGEAAVGLDEPVDGDAGLALEGVDVLREAGVQPAAVGKQLHEAVCQRGPVPTGVEFAGERVDWLESGQTIVSIISDTVGGGEVVHGRGLNRK